MKAAEIFNKALNLNYLIIEDEDLKDLLSNSEILREENTILSDYIRLLQFNEHLFIQEISLQKEILIRKMNSLKDADLFIKDRLDFYERKWDGCGCKIDYYE